MCGLVAAFALDGRLPDDTRLHRALDAVAHRGPDGRTLRVGGRCALGHTRLAIVDRAGGAQPIADTSGRAIIANGEIYGYAEERARLARAGRAFRTRGDSEVILALYEELGDAAPRALRGEFAFVIWDAPRQRLFCARDRFGVRPLYFTQHAGALLVASSVRALHALGAEPGWDEDALLQVHSMQYPRPGETLFRGVCALPPGHLLSADARGIRVVPYALPAFPQRSEPPPDEADVVDRFRSLFDAAVRERASAEVPVAMQLSGGLDSSAVAAVAAEALAKPTCFTVRFVADHPDDDSVDELAQASLVAEHLGARHEVVDVDAAAVVEHMGEAVEQAEGVSIDAHLVAKWMLARRARALGFPVLLTGEGADELLAGYAHLRADFEGDALHETLTRANPSLGGMHLPSGDALSTASVEARLGFVPTFLRAKATLGYRVRALLGPGAARLEGVDAFARALDVPGLGAALSGRGRVEQAKTLWTCFALGGYILPVVGDGAEMAHAVEGRLPFLDPRLWAEVTSWPTRYRMRPGLEKHVLREAMRGRLPEAIRARPKHPFLGSPVFARASRGSRAEAFLLDTLAEGAKSVPFFDSGLPDRVRHALATTPRASQRALEPALQLLLSVAVIGARIINRSAR